MIYDRINVKYKRVCWGLTGAGHLLKESIEVIEKLLNMDFDVTLFISRAGSEVLRIYGLYQRIKDLEFKFNLEVIDEFNEGYSYPKAAKVYVEDFDFLVISPLTFNTLSKIAHGIADNLITNLVQHALKVNLPIIVVPTDLQDKIEIVVPIAIDRSMCRNCSECIVVNVCPNKAIYILKGKPHIDLTKCNLCSLCIKSCPKNAIKMNIKKIIRQHPLTIELLVRLEKWGIKILDHPSKIFDLLSL